MHWPAHPTILELNTWVWLQRLSARAGRPVDLGSVPAPTWDAVEATGADAVWFMGVWHRSPAGLAIASSDPEQLAGWRAELPGLEPHDVVGSPYCVQDYEVDPRLGGREGLAAARAALAARGIGVVLDYVPNHTAPDHPWVTSHPECYVRGTPEDLADPVSFVEIDSTVFARGRDPFFPAWADVVQLDAFAPALRTLAIDTVRDIADQCDGVRCDMAMLLLDDVFARTWGGRVGAPLGQPYWPELIGAVRSTHRDFRFLAEAYWDLEWTLQQQGFDHCYDKTLYDRLRHGDAGSVRAHLSGDLAYQRGLVRFVENHDEPRAAAVFPARSRKAVAVTALTQAGARLVHDGQSDGRTVHYSVFLARWAEEPVDADLRAFYERLFAVLQDPTFHEGDWQLCEQWGWPDDDRVRNLVAWRWDGPSRWLVVVNLSDERSAGMVRAPWVDLRGEDVRLHDPTNDVTFDRRGDDLCDGLYVDLEGWAWHVFRVDRVGA